MVISRTQQAEAGFVMADLVMAMGMLLLAMLPLAGSFVHEQKLCRAYYYRSVAMELIDGEFEILLSTPTNQFQQGKHSYSIKAAAATNLPPGDFMLTIEARHMRLEWVPLKTGFGGRVVREVNL